jgi:hypothetical protein
MLLAFAPFIAFAILDHFAARTPALVIAALVSFALIGRELALGRSRTDMTRAWCQVSF